MKKIKYDKRKKLIDFGLKLSILGISKFLQDQIYDADFFNDANELKILSSQKVAKILCECIDFETVFDIGCGMGLYIEELFKQGKKCIGCDASPDGVRMASEDIIVFLADATNPVLLNRKNDVVICFEVAEHIPKRYSRQLVRNCTTNGKRILFTAALPGQGGVGHINEQPYEFWIKLFEKEGFTHDSNLSKKIRKKMTSQNVVPWIASNLMVFIMANS